MDQYLLIPFLVGWTSIYQLFWCSPGVQGFDTLPLIYGPVDSVGTQKNESMAKKNHRHESGNTWDPTPCHMIGIQVNAWNEGTYIHCLIITISMIMGISRVYMIIYGILMYIGIPHVQTHPYLPCQGTVERISLAKCHSSHCFYGHMMNASLVPLRDASLSLCGCTGSSLAIHPRFEKKRFQWLLHVPTKRNLKVVAATMIHPVPLSPSSTVNWSRGNVMSICVQRLTITKTPRSCWRFVANTQFAITTELHSAFLRQAQHAFYAVCIQVSIFLNRWVAVHPKRRHQGISLDWR